MARQRRLYFLLPDVESARSVLNEMLLARIGEKYIRFLGRRGTLPPDLPEAGVMQKTDFVHAAQRGLFIGGALGAAAGGWVYLDPPAGVELREGVILGAALFGAAFGMWASSLVGAGVPNHRLRSFEADLDRGNILMMVDVPMNRADEIANLVSGRHPEAMPRGFEPTIPAFP